MKTKHITEAVMHAVFFTCGMLAIAFVAIISLYIITAGLPAIKEIGLGDFLLGTVWKSTAAEPSFGILPFILTSIWGTLGAIVIGVPVGVLTAVFLSKVASPRVASIVRPAVDLLAGIPSVVYGFFGLTVMVPMVREHLGGNGNSMLTASLLLGMMILPTIIGVALSSIRAVPESYYEGSLALGASHERSVFFVVFPAAKSGVMAGVILGVGRAIGETMAVIMVAGNQPRMPKGILEGVRTLTTNIVMEMGYASGMHREALIATAAVLFVFILIINFSFSMMKRRSEK